MDDLISRQQAIDAFNTNVDELVVAGKENADSVEKYLNRVIDKIKELPSAEPKRGWWIEIINSRGVVVALRCSRCEKSPRHGVRSDFCPNCGADMRQREE